MKKNLEAFFTWLPLIVLKVGHTKTKIRHPIGFIKRAMAAENKIKLTISDPLRRKCNKETGDF